MDEPAVCAPSFRSLPLVTAAHIIMGQLNHGLSDFINEYPLCYIFSKVSSRNCPLTQKKVFYVITVRRLVIVCQW